MIDKIERICYTVVILYCTKLKLTNMAHDPAKNPDQVFNDSPTVKSFHGAIQVELAGGKTEVALPTDYPEHFIDRTIAHFNRSGWKVEHDVSGKKLKFTAGKPKPSFFEAIFG